MEAPTLGYFPINSFVFAPRIYSFLPKWKADSGGWTGCNLSKSRASICGRGKTENEKNSYNHELTVVVGLGQRPATIWEDGRHLLTGETQPR